MLIWQEVPNESRALFCVVLAYQHRLALKPNNYVQSQFTLYLILSTRWHWGRSTLISTFSFLNTLIPLFSYFKVVPLKSNCHPFIYSEHSGTTRVEHHIIYHYSYPMTYDLWRVQVQTRSHLKSNQRQTSYKVTPSPSLVKHRGILIGQSQCRWTLL